MDYFMYGVIGLAVLVFIERCFAAMRHFTSPDRTPSGMRYWEGGNPSKQEIYAAKRRAWRIDHEARGYNTDSKTPN